MFAVPFITESGSQVAAVNHELCINGDAVEPAHKMGWWLARIRVPG